MEPTTLRLVYDARLDPSRAEHAAREPREARDGVVARALALLAGELAAPWTVAKLARRVAVSRPVLARRFHVATGSSPMRHLTGLRMERAAELLRQAPELSLAAVAEQVGYASEFAFNRAFKRHHGLPPGSFRRGLAPRAAA